MQYYKVHTTSPEIRLKMSLAKKGKHPWNYNKKGYKVKPCSEERKLKIGLANKGRNKGIKPPHLCTPEVQEKIKKALTGKKLSPERIEKSRLAHLGLVPSKETRKKLSEAMKGKRPWNWTGNILSESQEARKSREMRLWKRACLERDNFTDQITGQRGGRLVVHHINNFADYPELRTSLENGITLSKEVHIEFHHIYGNKNNTREQLEEFMIQKKLGNLATAL
jgi:hypothetical protein